MSLRERIHDAAVSARSLGAGLWRHVAGSKSQALAHFIRPDLGGSALSRVMEPVVAASAMLALAVLVGVGALSLAGLLVAAALIYLIVTQVFGIELDIETPPA
ncbi:MAG: hypothetical protein HYZ27_08925 [Deltaproteobacteria bacterium]|nr:hypothetical protein [Deltaproteobacteria bacterium]